LRFWLRARIAVHDLAILGDVEDAFASVDAGTVEIAATAIYKVALTVGGFYAVVPALTVVLVNPTASYNVIGTAPTFYEVVAPTSGEVVGCASTDDKVVSA